eukprot:gene5014-8612_t
MFRKEFSSIKNIITKPINSQLRFKKKNPIVKRFQEKVTSPGAKLGEVFLQKPKISTKILRPTYKYVIMIKDNKIGLEGEKMLLKAPLANFLIGKKRAVDDTPEAVEKYISSKSEEFWAKQKARRERYNLLKILTRGVIKFYRKVDSYDHYIYPITAMDVCNRTLQLLKVVITPEQLEWPKDLKKPGNVEVNLRVDPDTVIRYRIMGFQGNVKGYLLKKVGIFSAKDSPTWFTTPNEIPSVSFNLRIESNNPVQIALIHHTQFKFVGYTSPKTPNVISLCQNGKLFVRDIKDYWMKDIQKIPQEPVEYEHTITRSGLYYLFIVSCRDDPIKLDGTITVMNPYGHIVGEKFGLLPFFFVLAILYFGFSIVWMFFMIKNYKYITKIHVAVTGLFFLSMITTAFSYFFYLQYDTTGLHSPLLDSFTQFLITIRKIISRVLVILIAMGWGITTFNLGNTTVFVGIYSIVYLVISYADIFIQEMKSELFTVTILVSNGIQMAVAFIDAIFFVWVLISVYKTLKKLVSRKQTAKVLVFNRFKWVLIFYCICAALWFSYETFLNLSPRDIRDSRWESIWTNQAYWEVLYFLILSLLMLFWRPAEVFLFEYTVVPSEENDDEIEMPSNIKVDKKQSSMDGFALLDDFDDSDENEKLE